jgi:hypothetical protein
LLLSIVESNLFVGMSRTEEIINQGAAVRGAARPTYATCGSTTDSFFPFHYNSNSLPRRRTQFSAMTHGLDAKHDKSAEASLFFSIGSI